MLIFILVQELKQKNQLIEMFKYGFMCDKIYDIPSIEVSDKNKFKKKQQKNVTLILQIFLDIVFAIKEIEIWSIKVIDVKARLPTDIHALKSLRSHINVKTRPPIDNYACKSLMSHIITHRWICIKIINITYVILMIIMHSNH